MIEVTRKLVGAAMRLDTIDDAVKLQKWAKLQPGLYATVSGRVDGTWLIEVGGTQAHSVVHVADVDDIDRWVVFDGEQFSILTDDEYAARGYAPQ
ncbi:hypothetical protein SEA_EDUGATOR_26 [Mycobacterium phage Edugator]|uniref:Uncharacterized protein n=2 Tax=Kratiovirus larva TaxID=1056831 RepID=A0A222ZLT9_9CAUD|nr:hypothetical protein CL76_gp75 [Mycobacterium phage Larva]AEL19682.1 hypothetical protein LARVA_27 [Mycobacterium phage Larva]ASR85723.1 hypothetical protein SEA_EDUGATOR_26 [Mycobacterium phage Edugator]